MTQHSITEYTELDATNLAEAKAEFLQNSELRVPHFRYERPLQSISQLESKIWSIDQIRSEMLHDHDLDSQERKVILQLIQGLKLQFTLLLAASKHRAYLSGESKHKLAAQMFAACNYNRYGNPDRDLVFSLIGYELNQLDDAAFTANENAVLNRLLANLPDLEDSPTAKIFAPETETIKRFGELVRHYMTPLFRHIPVGQAEFTPEEVKVIVDEILNQEIRPWSGTKFHAEVSEEKTALSVDQIERILWIPRHRAKGNYTREVVESVVCGHEMIHLFRGVPFEDCGMPFLSTGFPGYDEAEEGITTACELAISGKEYEPARTDYYINIGLVQHFGYDFRRIFEIRRDLIFLSKVNPEDDTEKKQKCMQAAENQAFSEANRATRGTGVLPYHKDLIYFNGNQKIWRYITEYLDRPDELINSLFWSGKTDPLNAEHMTIAHNAVNGIYGNPARMPWNN